MTFFDDFPEPPQKPREPRRPARPAWAGPPSDELPAVVPLGEFLYTSPGMVMAVKLVEVFSTGCTIELQWSVRRGEEQDRDWDGIRDRCFNHPGTRRDTGGLMLGIAYPDGRKASAAQPGPAMFDGTEEITGPVLTLSGGGGGGGDDEQVLVSNRYWLWPLPLDGDLRVVAKWDSLGMPESSVVISGDLLGAAAGRVRKYWAE